MITLDELKKGSASHKVKLLTGGAFEISPVTNSTTDLDRFQTVAQQAIELAGSEGRHCLPHPVNRHSLDGYDTVVIGEEN